MLDLSHQKLNKLPVIPNTIKYLDISYNDISVIDKLPSKLVYLNCSFNNLSALPELPKTLRYLNISYNNFSQKPAMDINIEFFDDHNLYNEYNYDQKGTCFDFNLNSFDDIDFYLISSKDNLIIRFKDDYICYNRRDLRFIYINSNLYELEDPIFKGLRVNTINKNQLRSQYYSLYNIIEGGKTVEVIPYRRSEFFK
jgi:Leucine-rich repeat (LRR) protein